MAHIVVANVCGVKEYKIHHGNLHLICSFCVVPSIYFEKDVTFDLLCIHCLLLVRTAIPTTMMPRVNNPLPPMMVPSPKAPKLAGHSNINQFPGNPQRSHTSIWSRTSSSNSSALLNQLNLPPLPQFDTSCSQLSVGGDSGYDAGKSRYSCDRSTSSNTGSSSRTVTFPGTSPAVSTRNQNAFSDTELSQSRSFASLRNGSQDAMNVDRKESRPFIVQDGVNSYVPQTPTSEQDGTSDADRTINSKDTARTLQSNDSRYIPCSIQSQQDLTFSDVDDDDADLKPLSSEEQKDLRCGDLLCPQNGPRMLRSGKSNIVDLSESSSDDATTNVKGAELTFPPADLHTFVDDSEQDADGDCPMGSGTDGEEKVTSNDTSSSLTPAQIIAVANRYEPNSWSPVPVPTTLPTGALSLCQAGALYLYRILSGYREYAI